MVTFILVRHGESTDNTRSLWAGWKDSPLTNHGMNQAKALGALLSSVKLKAILCSDLKRARMTAEAIYEEQSDPKPLKVSSSLLREQNYGSGEGKKWGSHRDPNLSLDEHFEKGLFPALRGRLERFPGGESLEDLAERARQVIEQLLLPFVWEEEDEACIVVVSHGSFLSELISTLVQRSTTKCARCESIQPGDFRGMRNTAWTKVSVTATDLIEKSLIEGSKPPLTIQVKDINNCDHLLSLKRQRGGIGSSAYDSRQKDIRGFFKGGAEKEPSGREVGRRGPMVMKDPK